MGVADVMGLLGGQYVHLAAPRIPILGKHGDRRWIVLAVMTTPCWFLPLWDLLVTAKWVLRV